MVAPVSEGRASDPRFPILDPGQMTPRQSEVATTIADGPRGGLRGPYLALIHHPDLADVVQQMGAHLRYRSALPKDLIELAILLIARHWTCQYEWVAHERVARASTDLPDDVIRTIQRGEIPGTLTDEQRMVHDFVIGTVKRGSPADAVYDEFANRFGREAVLDLLVTCGYYCMLAMLLNTTQVPLPEGTPPPLRERL
jgi:4-carboxymuconolactone decarboxylase